jgi:hypothetical protein
MMKMRDMPSSKRQCAPGVKVPQGNNLGQIKTSRKQRSVNPFHEPARLLRRGCRLLPAKRRQGRAGAVKAAFHRSDRQVEPGGNVRHLAFLPQNLHITGRKLRQQGLILFGQGKKALPPLPI